MAIGPLSTPNTPAFAGLETFRRAGLAFGRVAARAGGLQRPRRRGGRHRVVGGAVDSDHRRSRRARSPCSSAPRPMRCRPTTGRSTPSVRRASRPTTRAFASATAACAPGFGSELSPHPLPTMQVSAEERDALFEQRWAIGGFSLLGAFADTLTDMRANDAGVPSSCAARSAASFATRRRRNGCRRTHPIGCKRLCVDTGYYDTFNRPNVHAGRHRPAADRRHHARRPRDRRARATRSTRWCWPPASTPSPAR